MRTDKQPEHSQWVNNKKKAESQGHSQPMRHLKIVKSDEFFGYARCRI